MKNLKEKKGISLIVLIITIIVMIILAAAIILSLNNSGIIDRANKAKTDSDTANLKEYVNVLMAEWELGTKETSKEAYVNENLEKKGYTQALLMNDGTLYTNLQANAKAALKAGIKIGNVVKYKVISNSEPSKAADNGDSNQDISNKTDFVWRYIGISDNGEIMIAPDITSDAPTITLYNKVGYEKGPEELNRLCEVLYSTDKGEAESMNINHVTKLLGYTGEKGSYYDYDGENWYFPTTEAMKMSDLELKLDKTLDRGYGGYDGYSDYYEIDKTKDVNNMDLVFFENTYWLASNCLRANFYYSGVDHVVRVVSRDGVGAYIPHGPMSNAPDCCWAAIRPVVRLYSSANLSIVSDDVWSID